MREIRGWWAIGCAVALSGVALAGCAPAAPSVGAPQETPGNAAGVNVKQPPAPVLKEPAACSRATKVVIAADGSAFSPGGVTIQRGAFLAIVNKSGTARPLRSTPDAGMVASTIGIQERQVIQFPRAGSFAVKTGDAVLRLTVAGESGCGAVAPTLTITSAGRFAPRSAQVRATENFAVVNDSGDVQSVSCSPGENRDHTRLEAGETQILALDEPGRYVCASRQHPGVKVTVTVSAA